MLRINSIQIDKLDAAAVNDFHFRLVSYLRETSITSEFLEENSDEEVFRLIRRSELHAGRFGIQTEFGITLWTSLRVVVGVQPDDIDGFTEYMAWRTTEDPLPDDRLEKLVDCWNETCRTSSFSPLQACGILNAGSDF